MLVRVMPNYTRRQSYLYTIFDPPCTCTDGYACLKPALRQFTLPAVASCHQSINCAHTYLLLPTNLACYLPCTN